MAVPIVCGIETEYGIIVRRSGGGEQPESNPMAASSTLVSSYVSDLADQGRGVGRPHRVGWDFEDETPANDARGGPSPYSYAPEVESHLVNAVLTNGSRYYVDHAHPELSTPECRTALQTLLYDRAGEEILLRSMRVAPTFMPPGQEIVVYKNNSDGKGQSYGCHENYMLSRGLPFGKLVTNATAHFVTRQIYCGAGKVGTELPGVRRDAVNYQISQRADFFEEEVGLETTLKRPIVNTRDEPHCDASKYRRLHVIVGDANMSEVATLVKLGATAIVLAMIEDDVLGDDLVLANPVGAIRAVSHDPSLQRTVTLRSGRRATAMEIQWSLLERARKYERSHGLEAVGDEVGADVLRRWEAILAGLERDPDSVADTVDWVAKRRLVDGMADRHGLRPGDARLKALDLQYHDMRPDKCLATRVGLQTVTSADEVERAITEPPVTTRAYFRGRCLQKWPTDIVAANWDSLVFDVGRDPLRRVPMMEPLRGTADHVASLIDDSDTAAELLARLGA